MQLLQYNQHQLESLCRDYHVRRLAVYGSVLRGDDTPASDLDLLVEFEPNAGIGFFELSRLERSFSGLFHRKVDLNTPGFLNVAFRTQVQEHAHPIYTR